MKTKRSTNPLPARTAKALGVLALLLLVAGGWMGSTRQGRALVQQAKDRARETGAVSVVTHKVQIQPS